MSGTDVPLDPATQKIIFLYKGVNFAASYKSMETPDGVDYQVPAGKVAVVIDTGTVGGYNSNAVEGLYSTSAADADTDKIPLIVNPYKPATNSPVYIEVAAALYFTCYDTATGLYEITIWEKNV